MLKYNRQRLANFQKRISDTKVNYEYDKLFNYEKAMKGVYADHSVKSHKFSALDNNNVLIKEHLFAIVRKNNAEYLKKPTSLIKEVNDEITLFLLNLYESTINYHLNLNDSGYNSYNAEFKKWYKSIRGDLFDAFENLLEAEYQKYQAKKDKNKNTINASMKWLSPEKRDFLIEKFEDNLCDFKLE